jgi:RHS repeat-associated protein
MGVKQVVQFDYDALGRRIKKTDGFGSTLFLWDGPQMLQEQRGSNVATFLYEPDSFVPMARIDSGTLENPLRTISKAHAGNGNAARNTGQDAVYYFHNDVSGIPEELTNSAGEISWEAQYKTWGNTVSESWVQVQQDDVEQVKPLAQNLRFQGQYLDRESGLHYNTFRYYDPDIGKFISPDPIGLAGGINLYHYAPNPVGWRDPLGWAALPDLVRYAPRDELTAKPGSRKTAINRAWVEEKALIEKTGMGTRDWSQSEIDLIKSTKNGDLASVMSGKGYTGHHINSVENNGTLGTKWKGDPRNIVFLENPDHPNSTNMPNARNEHHHSPQGHRGTTNNTSRGRLIDREATGKCRS